MRIGLALGGGGARGFFHIGVLKVLEKLKININIISGISIGSLVGSLYALYKDINTVEDIILNTIDNYKNDIELLSKYFNEAKFINYSEKSFNLIKELYFWNLLIIKTSLVDEKIFLKIFKDIFKDFNFSDCKIPFISTCVNISNGELFFIKNGPLYTGVLASCSLVGFFPPVNFEDKILVDGGILEVVPTSALKKECNFIVGVNVENTKYNSNYKNAIDLLCISDNIRYKKIVENNLKEADFIISGNLEKFTWADFEKAKELIKLGEETTSSLVNELTKKIKKEKIKSIFFKKNA